MMLRGIHEHDTWNECFFIISVLYQIKIQYMATLSATMELLLRQYHLLFAVGHGSFWEHNQEYLKVKDHPNLLFLKFEDMIKVCVKN